MRERISLDNAKKIHFIGIGGISMSGLAEILQRDGYEVSGSDDVLTEITERLDRLGIKIFHPNAAENISRGIDLVVYTAAVKADNPEFRAALEMGIELIERAPFIGKILHGYEPICIAGSHGKTTTTSMVAEVLLAARHDPTISIGGHMNRGGLNYRIGGSKYFVLESCEFSNSFHHWHPHIGIILNIDADHLDFFGNMKNLIEAFGKFAGNIRPEGALVIQAGVQGIDEITKKLKCDIITFGLKNNSKIYADKIKYENGNPSFDVMDGEKFLAHVSLPLPGEYNMLNALAAFAAALLLGIPPNEIADALCNIKGTKRRFEHKGMYNGIEIIDDYAHHPTEIISCLAAARQKMDSGRIVCLFQPHTYTRTRNLFDETVKSFSDADKIVLLPIYAAREPYDPTVSSEMLAEEIIKIGGDAIFIKNFDEAECYLKKILCSGDLLITMGAGDVFRVGDKMLGSDLSTLSTGCEH
ncbi:MAG: UDP-N-acetylmuramate--L-alanine ligase [Clostridiales bacterium]|nr:UDP-N-acetylmuramate--L-alanine ligase [Clostridiales bacterium]